MQFIHKLRQRLLLFKCSKSYFADNVTPVSPKNSCKLVGKSLIKFFSLVITILLKYSC